MLEAEDLACLRGDRVVFAGLSFAVPAGGALLLTGRNGAGKSSLLRVLAGLLPAAEGRVLWRGQDVAADRPAQARRLRYLSHQDALKPALSLVSKVVYFKVVKAGRSVSYGATWIAPVDTRVVTVPIGYGDGYPRALSSRGEVLVRGMRRPIVGRVCMDQLMVDLGSAGTAYNGDEVVLIGRQAGETISCEAVAQAAGTIPYEILTGLNARIPREYVRHASGAGSAA